MTGSDRLKRRLSWPVTIGGVPLVWLRLATTVIRFNRPIPRRVLWGAGHTNASRGRVLLLSHPPSKQHYSGAGRCRNDRRHQPAAERKQHSDVIADERAGNTH